MDMVKIEPNSERWLSLEDLPNERWKDIKDFEGLYKISDYGRVKSLERFRKLHSKLVRVPEIIRKNGYDKDGYQIIPLNKNSKKYMKKIHRLVAEAFIVNPDNKKYVNHKDCNRWNNNVNNLEWCTSKENVLYCKKMNHFYHPTRGKFRGDNPLSKKIIQLDIDCNIIKVWDCAEDVADYLHVNKRTIGKCCRFEQKTVKGFILRYEDNFE